MAASPLQQLCLLRIALRIRLASPSKTPAEPGIQPPAELSAAAHVGASNGHPPRCSARRSLTSAARLCAVPGQRADSQLADSRWLAGRERTEVSTRAAAGGQAFLSQATEKRLAMLAEDVDRTLELASGSVRERERECSKSLAPPGLHCDPGRLSRHRP